MQRPDVLTGTSACVAGGLDTLLVQPELIGGERLWVTACLAGCLHALPYARASLSSCTPCRGQAIYVPADDLTDPAPATTFAHLDATTVLSRSIAELGIYPAVDPLDSTSRMLDVRIIGQEHYDVARGVQRVLQARAPSSVGVLQCGCVVHAVLQTCAVRSSKCVLAELKRWWAGPFSAHA